MDASTIDEVATELRGREVERRADGRVTDRWPGLDLGGAYAVQRRLIAFKEESGDPVVGLKLGLTSVAKQQQMNVSEPITALLTASMRATGESVDTTALIHPRIEPEIAFVMARDLVGPHVTAADALAAVGSVHAAFEVIDSRYENFSFSLPDVVADNASAASFFLSDHGVSPDEIHLAAEPVELWEDDRVVAEATGAAVLGDPAEALAMAANALAERGGAVEASWVVLTGALTDAIRLQAGSRYRASFRHLGVLTVVST